jgi:hypothetical protein
MQSATVRLTALAGVVALAGQGQALAQQLGPTELQTRIKAVSDLEQRVAADPSAIWDQHLQEAILTQLETENATVAQHSASDQRGGQPELTERYAEYYAQVLGLANRVKSDNRVVEGLPMVLANGTQTRSLASYWRANGLAGWPHRCRRLYQWLWVGSVNLLRTYYLVWKSAWVQLLASFLGFPLLFILLPAGWTDAHRLAAQRGYWAGVMSRMADMVLLKRVLVGAVGFTVLAAVFAVGVYHFNAFIASHNQKHR